MKCKYTGVRWQALLFLSASLISCTSFAANYTLQHNRWSLLTVPANSSTQTIEQLFSDDLPASTYTKEWVIYLFDPQVQDYVKATTKKTLAQGDGFWMLQNTGVDVTIDLPPDLPEGDADISRACVSTAGCFAAPIFTSTAKTTWSLLGAPFSDPVVVNQINMSSTKGSCSGGCDLGQAYTTGYLSDVQWTYNASSAEYEKLTNSSYLSPWQGLWVNAAALPAETSLSLLLPKPDTTGTGIQAVCESSSVLSNNQITANNGTKNLFHGYSKRQAVNADETKLVLTHSSTKVFDIVDGKAVNPTNINISSEVMWSEFDPNILFGTQYSGNYASKFVSYNISTNETISHFDVQQLGVTAPHNLTVGDYEGHVQQDRFVVLRMTNDSVGTDKLIALDFSTTPATILGELDTPSSPKFNWASFSPDGKTIVIQNGAADGIYSVHNPDFSYIVGPTSTPPNTNFRFEHMDWVVLDSGENVLVVATDQNQSIFKPRTDSWISLGTTINSNGISNSGHISGLTSKNSPGIYLASDTYPNQDSYIVKLAGDQNISIDWFINIGEIWGGRENYNNQTKATISPTGKYVIYNKPVAGVAQTFLITMDNSGCPSI